MDKSLILEKSPKGKEEISSHKHGLSAYLRRTLILVDGISNIDGLREKTFGDQQLDEHIEQLLRDGFIQARIAGKSTGVYGAEGTTVFDERVNKLKWQLVDLVGDIVGHSYADRAAKKIIAAPDTIAGLKETVKSCAQVIKLTIDKNKAKELEKKAMDLLKIAEKLHNY